MCEDDGETIQDRGSAQQAGLIRSEPHSSKLCAGCSFLAAAHSAHSAGGPWQRQGSHGGGSHSSTGYSPGAVHLQQPSGTGLHYLGPIYGRKGLHDCMAACAAAACVRLMLLLVCNMHAADAQEGCLCTHCVYA